MEEEFSAALEFLNGLQQSDNFETTGYDGRYLSLLESDAWADPSQFLETLDDNESAAQAPQKEERREGGTRGLTRTRLERNSARK
ncbi:hypothetical protein PI125_g3120 [Phytophthora idaei]|nr:hypothetical protein PI125_g3120 [Phytophthora idaei]